jgi:FixJ family two-component response regulator
VEKRPVILFVDDEPSIINLYRQFTSSLGIEGVFANSAEEAWKKIDDKEIQVVISDYRMPGENGAELLARVREKYPKAIRIIVSGHTDSEVLIRSINSGHVFRFIEKPFTSGAIIDVINDALLLNFQKQALEQEIQNLREQNRRLKHLENVTSDIQKNEIELELEIGGALSYDKLCERLPVAVIVFDANQTIRYANAWGRKLLGANDDSHMTANSLSLELLVSIITREGDPTPTVETVGIASGDTYAVTIHPNAIPDATVICLTQLPD